MNKKINIERIMRIVKANEMIKIISSHGRHFFKYKNNDDIGYFKLKKNRLYWVDEYTKKEIYLHYLYWKKGFNNGGTLRQLVDELKNWILGKRENPPLSHLGPWPKYLCNGDLWGYGKDMIKVRKECKELFNK